MPDKTKFSVDWGPDLPVDPYADEGAIAKLWRLYNQPIAEDIPGAKEALEKFAQSVGGMPPTRPKQSVTPSLFPARSILPTTPPRTPDIPGEEDSAFNLAQKMKGFTAGALEAINPALVVQAASLGSGPAAIAANAAIAAQGAHEALDPTLPTWKRILGGAQVPMAVSGATSGLKIIQRAAPAVKDASTGSGIASQLSRLRDDIKNYVPISDELLQKNYPDLWADIAKNPKGSSAQAVYGPKGRLDVPVMAQVAARDKQVEQTAAQTAKNLNAQDKFKQGLVIAQAQAETEAAKRTAAGIAQADAERQAAAVEELRGTLTETQQPTSIGTTITGEGAGGLGKGKATIREVAPKPVKVGAESGPYHGPFDTLGEARDAARDLGYTSKDWDLENRGKIGGWHIVSKGPPADVLPVIPSAPAMPLEAPPEAPGGPAAGPAVVPLPRGPEPPVEPVNGLPGAVIAPPSELPGPSEFSIARAKKIADAEFENARLKAFAETGQVLPREITISPLEAVQQAEKAGVAEAPAAPESIQGGVAPVRLFKSPLEAAGVSYGDIKAAKAAGEKIPEAGRAAAGRAAQRLKQEAQAVQRGTAPTQIESALAEANDPATDPLHREMLKRWLSESGAAQIGMTGRLLSGAVGEEAGRREDPLGNPVASAIAGAGAGLLLPEIAGGAIRALPEVANLYAKAQPFAESGLNWANRLHNTGLLSPFSVIKKAAGDIGGLSLAAVEHPLRSGDILRQFTSPAGRALLTQNFKEGFAGPEAEQAAAGLENFIQKGPLSWSGRAMGGLTKATKGALGETGFSPAEQAYYTLTASPSTKGGKALYGYLSGGTGSKLAQHLSPFARIGINRLERGIEYSPFGLLSGKGKNPEALQQMFLKAGLGTTAGATAYSATPEGFVKEHPTMASMLAALGGPLGLPILAGMAMKTAKPSGGYSKLFESNKTDWAKSLGAASETIGRDIPGLRLLEDITGRSFPEGFLRNYFSGYTNVGRPAATMMDPAEPDVSSKNLPESGRIFNRMLSNIPLVRGQLPRKPINLAATPKFTVTF